MKVPPHFARLVLQLSPSRLLQKLRNFPEKSPDAAEEPFPGAWQIVRHLVPAGATVVEVGAGFGTGTRRLAGLVGLGGKVVALEPAPRPAEVLAASFRRLGLGNVEVLAVAASSGDGTARLVVPQSEDGGERFNHAFVVPESPAAPPGTTVPTRTLDSLCARTQPPIEFVLCDVPGHLLHCLRGSGELLRKVKPAWLIRVPGDPDDGAQPAHVAFHLFETRGYAPYWFDGKVLRRRQPGDPPADGYFFLTLRHLHRIPSSLFGAFDSCRNHHKDDIDNQDIRPKEAA